MKRRLVAAPLFALAVVLISALSGCGGPWARANGEVIAFIAGSDEGTDVFVKKPRRLEEREAGPDARRRLRPAWSPDGEKVAFFSDSDESPLDDLYVVNADGTGTRRLVGGVRRDDLANIPPSWSPDGERIAVGCSADGDAGALEVCVVDADGSGAVVLTDGSEVASGPAWSPDGGKIAYSADGGEGGIYVTDTDDEGDRARLVAFEGDVDDQQLAWSPDGGRIAYTAENDEDVYAVDARGGSEPTRLSNTPGPDFHPVWSPDGEKISLTTGRDDALYVMNARDGTDEERLAEDLLFSCPPSWSPDGTRIAYTAEGEDGGANVVVVGSDGTDPEVLQTGAHSPAWRPTNGEGEDR